MNRVMRFAVVGAFTMALPACSSNFTRFDYPVMGMNGGPVEKTGNRNGYEADDQARDYSNNRYKAPDYNSTRKYQPESRYNSERYSSNSQNRYLDDRDVGNTASFGKKSTDYKRYADGGEYADGKDDYGRRELPDLKQQSRVEKPRSVARRDSSGHHVVSEGDTLYNISRRYGVDVSRIKRANDMDGNDIKLGQRLAIPGLTKNASIVKKSQSRKARSRYIVAQGDTAYSIARRHGISIAELSDANNNEDLTRLSMGQELVIPGDRVAGSRTEKPVRVASIDKKIGLSGRRTNVQMPKKKPANSKKIKSVSSGKFLWPARGRIVSNFGRQKSGTINDGVNIAIPAGTKIKSAGDGVVAYAGHELKGYGKLILVRHSNNWVTAYAHNKSLLVKRGDKVRRGQVIAKSGKSGSVTQPQLHFELRKGSKPVNPMRHLAIR